MATLYSVGRLPKALMQASISVALILREALHRSVVWFCSAAKPVPEPPPVTWIFTSGCLAHVNLRPFLGEDDQGVRAFDGDGAGLGGGAPASAHAGEQ